MEEKPGADPSFGKRETEIWSLGSDMQRCGSEPAGVIGPKPKNPAACSMVGRSHTLAGSILRGPEPLLSIQHQIGAGQELDLAFCHEFPVSSEVSGAVALSGSKINCPRCGVSCVMMPSVVGNSQPRTTEGKPGDLGGLARQNMGRVPAVTRTRNRIFEQQRRPAHVVVMGRKRRIIALSHPLSGATFTGLRLPPGSGAAQR